MTRPASRLDAFSAICKRHDATNGKPLPVIEHRKRLRELESAFAELIRSPSWREVPDEHADSIAIQVQAARAKLGLAERTAFELSEITRKRKAGRRTP